MNITTNQFNMKRCFLFLIIIFLVTSCSKEDIPKSDQINIVDVHSVTINVSTAGKLSSLIPSTKKDLITNLKLTGELNGDDIEYIREMAGNGGSWGSTTNGQLSVLDLSGVNIVAGGYYYYSNNYSTSLNEIGGCAFAGCIRLTSVIIPNSVTSIGNSAFLGCTGLTSITIPNSVTTIGNRAFFGCTGLTSVTIPNNVSSIGESAFESCTGITSLTLGNGVISIGQFAFKDCSISLLNFNSINCSFFSKRTFSFQSTLKILNIGENVKTLHGPLFEDCSGLTSVIIPNSVTSIENYVFYNCKGLSSVNIGSSVASIESSAFSDCTRLKEYIVSENNIKYCSLDGVLFNKNCTELIAYPSAKSNSYTIPSSVTSIGGSTFKGCAELTSVTIPNSVTSIGECAFESCTGITSITIPNSVTSIGNSAFNGCTGLTSVTMPNSVTSIGESAFKSCAGITLITIPNSVTSIGNSAFNGCTGLTSVTIPNSVTSIGSSVFYYCTRLKEFVVSENNKKYCSLDGVLFNKNCTELIAYPNSKSNSYTIPSSVTSIGSSAFSGCKGLFLVNIGSSVTSIGGSAFSGCEGLSSMNIGISVTSIGSSAFWYCTGISSLTIPNSVTSIERYAFSGCNGLKEIHCKTLIPPTVSSDIFDGINKTTCKLYVPKGSYSNYWGTTGWGDFKNIIDE